MKPDGSLTHGDRNLAFAREMRSNPTGAEKWLWECLRNRRCKGAKFYRQRRIGVHIADFLSSELKLIIELDGAGHERQVGYDLRRKSDIESLGYEVIRIGSDFPFSDPDEILPFIEGIIEAKILAMG